MKYLKAEFPIALALIILGLGFTLEHAAAAHGGALLWGALLVILAAIIGVHSASATMPKCWRCALASPMARSS